MRGRNLRRTLVAASAVLVLVLAVAGLLAFIVTSAGAGSSWNASMDELSAALVRTEGGYAFTGETRTVDVHVRTLRQKLGPAGAYVQTVRGYGYKMDGEG